MRTKAGLPGWFPEDFKADPALLDAFGDGEAKPAAARSANRSRFTWQAGDMKAGAGSDNAPGGQHVASLRHLAASGTPAQKKAAAAVLARMDAKPN